MVDAQGNAVSNTYTLEGGYGSRVVVDGAGFILNNEMGDFNKKPGVTTPSGTIGTAPNVIAPGKRMLSSMTPTIVTRGGKLVLVTGSPGGRTIINTVHQIVLNVTAFGMDAYATVDAGRFDHEWIRMRSHLSATPWPRRWQTRCARWAIPLESAASGARVALTRSCTMPARGQRARFAIRGTPAQRRRRPLGRNRLVSQVLLRSRNPRKDARAAAI